MKTNYMNTYRYNVFRPSGNDTALVNKIVENKILRKKISDTIIKKEKNVEQVGFVKKSNDNYQLLMAGGEFCGNALRSAAFFSLMVNKDP